ncbi:MAG: LysM domain-containing protein [Desulfobacterales bacterium]
MAFVKHRKPVRTLWVLLFLWILSSCAYQKPPFQPPPEEPPPVEIKTETLVPEPETPVETKPDTNIVAPEKSALELPASTPSTSGFYTHKVRWEEETLSHIAKWYTGTVKNWKAIAKANPELDPKKIDTGDTIFIPENLLISRKPMPFSFLRPTVHKKAKPAVQPNKKAMPSDPPKLFGPIDTESPPMESDAAKLFGPIE